MKWLFWKTWNHPFGSFWVTRGPRKSCHFLAGGFPIKQGSQRWSTNPKAVRATLISLRSLEEAWHPVTEDIHIYRYILTIHTYIYNGICIFIFIVYICVWKHQTERVHPENLGYLWKIFLAPAWTPLAQALGESGQVRSCGCGVWWGYWPSLFKPWKGDIF